MNFPQFKKTLHQLLGPFERVVSSSKRIVLSASMLTLVASPSAAKPKIPAEPPSAIEKRQISKFSAKYLLKSAATSLSSLLAQHRSRSSHRSHSSHSSHQSHSSHYSSSSYPRPSSPAPSHSSHYSSADSSSPSLEPARPSPPVVSQPAPKTSTSAVILSDYFNDDVLSLTKWRLGSLTGGATSIDEQIEVNQSDGNVQIQPRGSLSARSYNGVITRSPVDMTAAFARVEVLQVTNGSAHTIFAVGWDSDNWYGFVFESGKL